MAPSSPHRDAPDGPFAPSTPATFFPSSDVPWPGDDQEACVPLNGCRRVEKMTLEIANGVSGLSLGAAAPEDAMAVRVSGGQPRISVDRDIVRVNRGRDASLLSWLADLLVHGAAGPKRIVLSAAVSWTVHIKAGAAALHLEVSALMLDALFISGGANDVVLRLPRPRGVVPVCLRGGASSVRIERPAGVAMAVDVIGGAADLTVDGRYAAVVARRRRLVTEGYDDALDRYEVTVEGGASEVSVLERRTEEATR